MVIAGNFLAESLAARPGRQLAEIFLLTGNSVAPIRNTARVGGSTLICATGSVVSMVRSADGRIGEPSLPRRSVRSLH